MLCPKFNIWSRNWTTSGVFALLWWNFLQEFFREPVGLMIYHAWNFVRIQLAFFLCLPVELLECQLFFFSKSIWWKRKVFLNMVTITREPVEEARQEQDKWKFGLQNDVVLLVSLCLWIMKMFPDVLYHICCSPGAGLRYITEWARINLFSVSWDVSFVCLIVAMAASRLLSLTSCFSQHHRFNEW